MAVYAWHEPSPAYRGQSSGWNLRSVLVGSCSPRSQKFLFYNSEGGAQGDRASGEAVPTGVRLA